MRSSAQRGFRLLEPKDDAAAGWLDPHIGKASTDTHAKALQESPDHVVVTTEQSIADRYASLRYLDPGEPIVDQLLIEVAANVTAEDRMLTIDGEASDSFEEVVIVVPRKAI